MGGRDIASLIAPPGIGVWSRDNPVFCSVVCLLGFTGVAGELGVMTSAVRIAPCLVRFSVHATWWNFGEVECSRVHFLDMAAREDDRVRVVAEFLVVVSKRMQDFRHISQ